MKEAIGGKIIGSVGEKWCQRKGRVTCKERKADWKLMEKAKK